MKRLAIAASIILAVATLYKIKYPTYTYRYRMTVTVDVDGETRSGSSVVEVRVSKQPRFLPEVLPLDQSVRGQAVFVELPNGKNVVALLAAGSTAENGGFPNQVVPDHFKLNIFDDRVLARLRDLRGHWELGADSMPTLVTVANTNDAATVQVVGPDQLDKQLGAHLRSIAIDMTADPIGSPNIETKLPFLLKETDKRSTLHYPNVFIPNYTYFVRG
jgi:hypothetical protein